ncbi:MAG TPA: DUF1876 domain-containing protein [Marmoricola sp.]|nr:DUF1876 domain-containing protein [Marmoricola sp.]
MIETKRWKVDIFLGEQDGRTRAEARLIPGERATLVGTGSARLNPQDADVPEIGEELAVARALSDLGHQLLATTALDIEAITHEAARLDA